MFPLKRPVLWVTLIEGGGISPDRGGSQPMAKGELQKAFAGDTDHEEGLMALGRVTVNVPPFSRMA